MYLVPLFIVVTVTEDATAARDSRHPGIRGCGESFLSFVLLRPCWVYHSFGSPCNLLHGAVMSTDRPVGVNDDVDRGLL